MQRLAKLKTFSSSGLILSTLFSAHAFATSSLEGHNYYSGTFQTAIELNAPSDIKSKVSYDNRFSTESMTRTKIITLMRLNPTAELTEKAEAVAANIEAGFKTEKNFSQGILPFTKSETAKDLRMNDLPVLDQGQYGTCVTFATTAILDVVLDEGDFIDQECTLALNLSLGKDYWDGANYSSQLIIPLQKYGVVQKNNCPSQYPDSSYKISTADYKKIVSDTVDIKKVSYKYFADLNLKDVRRTIDKGHRLSIGFMLKGSLDPISVRGFDINMDGSSRKGGLWACKQPGSTANYCGFAFAGHEVVVTGYDDTQELLKIRNSWSDEVADDGDFYMTYEFFNAMVIDGTEIW